MEENKTSPLVYEKKTQYSYGSASGSVKANPSTRISTRSSTSHLSTRTTILMNGFAIAASLSTAFSYSCIMTTFFILTGPIECQRIEDETRKYYSYTISKSIALGAFAGIAGLAQLITPLIGLLSDSYSKSSTRLKYRGLSRMGKRMPYLILGTILIVIGLVGMMWASCPIHPVVPYDLNLDLNNNSNDDGGEREMGVDNIGREGNQVAYSGAWYQYLLFFLITMFGVNIVYTIMIVLVPDLVPPSQTGIANGTLALLVVTGSLFGFFSFDILLQNNVMGMYKVYICVSVIAAVLTCIYVLEREDTLKSMTFNQHHDGGGEEDEVDNAIKEPLVAQETTMVETSKEEYIPPFHSLIYILLYEPIINKTRSEMIAAYWIDTSAYNDFFIVTISRFFYYMGISSQTFFLYFIHDVLKQSTKTENPEAAVALLAIIGQSAGALTCYPVGILSDQYFNGRRKPFVYTACLLLSIGNLALLMCQTLHQMMIVCILLGAANGIYLTMDTSLAVDTLEEDTIYEGLNNDEEGKGGGEDGHGGQGHDHAQLLGIWGVCGFIGSALGPLIGGTALLVLGNIKTGGGGYYSTPTSANSSIDDDTMSTTFPAHPFYKIQGYEALFSLSAFYFFCSAWSLAFVKKKGV